jgi:hypothetical protein
MGMGIRLHCGVVCLRGPVTHKKLEKQQIIMYKNSSAVKALD